MRRPRWLAVAVAVAAVLPVVACGPDEPGGGGTTPVTSPSPVDTGGSASASPSPSETGPSEADFKAAEQAYRDFNAERNRVGKAGGAKAATEQMKANAAGPYLKSMTESLKRLADEGSHWTSGARIIYVRSSSKVRNNVPPGELTLRVCEDGRKNKVVTKSGRVLATGQAARGDVYVRKIDGSWKVWDGDAKAVTKCDE